MVLVIFTANYPRDYYPIHPGSMAQSLRYLVIPVLFFLLLPSPRPVKAMENWSLLRTIDLALSQSDAAHDLHDNLLLSRMEITTAGHRFDTRLVPLTNLGVRQGTGAQHLGMEFRKETDIGS